MLFSTSYELTLNVTALLRKLYQCASKNSSVQGVLFRLVTLELSWLMEFDVDPGARALGCRCSALL